MIQTSDFHFMRRDSQSIKLSFGSTYIFFLFFFKCPHKRGGGGGRVGQHAFLIVWTKLEQILFKKSCVSHMLLKKETTCHYRLCRNKFGQSNLEENCVLFLVPILLF
jgi:hypothetical protein